MPEFTILENGRGGFFILRLTNENTYVKVGEVWDKDHALYIGAKLNINN